MMRLLCILFAMISLNAFAGNSQAFLKVTRSPISHFKIGSTYNEGVEMLSVLAWHMLWKNECSIQDIQSNQELKWFDSRLGFDISVNDLIRIIDIGDKEYAVVNHHGSDWELMFVKCEGRGESSNASALHNLGLVGTQLTEDEYNSLMPQ